MYAALPLAKAGMVLYPADVRSCLQYVAALSNDVEYLNSRDATIMGSRNGHAPIYMWFTLTRKGYEGMRKDVERCLRNAHLLKVWAPSSNVQARCVCRHGTKQEAAVPALTMQHWIPTAIVPFPQGNSLWLMPVLCAGGPGCHVRLGIARCSSTYILPTDVMG